MTLLVGLAAAPVPILLGPSVQVIATPEGPPMRLTELLGERIGAWAAGLFGQDTMSAAEMLAVLPVALLLTAIVKALLGAAQWFAYERLGERIAMAMRRDLMRSFLGRDPSARHGDEARAWEAEVASAVTNDVRLAREFFVHYYGGLPRELAQTVVLAAALVMLSPKLFLIFLLGVAPLAVILSRVGKKLRKRAQRALADYSLLSEWLQQRLLGVETIKHYGTEGVESRKMRRLNDDLMTRFLRAARVKARTSPTIETLASIAGVVILIIALRDVAAGEASGAVQLSFFTTLAMLSQHGSKLGKYLNANREGAAALGRLAGLTSHLGATKSALGTFETRPGPSPRILCEDVHVRYTGAEREALCGFSFAFEPGRIHCLVGPSGAGKSTLFNVLLGLVRPSTGRLVFEGAREVAYLPQKVQLMPGTLAENVSYPDAGHDPARVRDALARVGLTAVVDELPQGIDEPIGEGGRGLSGGQAQRVLLARLWYRKAPVVLVDEGTSALDPELEKLAFELFRELADQGAVLLMIAHRMAAAATADLLLLVEGGRLRAAGTPEAVFATAAFSDALR